jgi:hypothetical protein
MDALVQPRVVVEATGITAFERGKARGQSGPLVAGNGQSEI